MSNLIPGNQKHLTLNDRLYIEHALDEGRSFRDIAKYLCKDPTTVMAVATQRTFAVFRPSISTMLISHSENTLVSHYYGTFKNIKPAALALSAYAILFAS